jgi:hypothetical protein
LKSVTEARVIALKRRSVGNLAELPSDHRKRRTLSVPVENQESNTHPTVAAFASLVLPSFSDAKSQRRS